MRAIQTIVEKKGRWVRGIEIPEKSTRIHAEYTYYCSLCHHEAYWKEDCWDLEGGQELFDYCPYCGARMEET